MKTYVKALQTIYGDNAKRESARYESLAAGFAARFGREPAYLFRAPGRVELGGNHTDHQHGAVLAASVDLDAAAAVGVRKDSRVVLQSEGYTLCELDLNDTAFREEERGTSLGLIRGVAARMEALGAKFGFGFDALVTSRVPAGSGLSSSAAFELLLAVIMNELYLDGKIGPAELAKAGQYAENVYFGKPSGLLDQLASACGGLVFADFKDPDAPLIKPLRADPEEFGFAAVIIDSGAGHENLTAEYAAIPGECGEISRFFGKTVLRDVPEEEFMKNLPELRKKAGDRAVLRALHFYAEHKRALAEAEAMEKGDIEAFLGLVNESGRSSALYLQNVVPAGAVKHQAMQLTLALAEKALGGRGAVRVHGGGFGGTALAFVPRDILERFTADMEGALGAGCVRHLRICPVGGTRLKEDEA